MSLGELTSHCRLRRNIPQVATTTLVGRRHIRPGGLCSFSGLVPSRTVTCRNLDASVKAETLLIRHTQALGCCSKAQDCDCSCWRACLLWPSSAAIVLVSEGLDHGVDSPLIGSPWFVWMQSMLLTLGQRCYKDSSDSTVAGGKAPQAWSVEDKQSKIGIWCQGLPVPAHTTLDLVKACVKRGGERAAKLVRRLWKMLRLE